MCFNKMKNSKTLLLLLGILFISFNLRAPITAVGSITNLIQKDLSLSSTMMGFITTIPLIAFAVVSPFVAKFSHRIGHNKTMLISLLLILFSELIRSYTGIFGLYLGTALIGIGIAIGNVLIPAIIKLNFSTRLGFVTSIYTSGMCIFAAVGAGISVPLAKNLNLGWQNTLAVWFILTIITIFIWLPQLQKNQAGSGIIKNCNGDGSIWHSKLAWCVTLFMGIQSLLFYSLVAWLPSIIMAKGLTANFAGNMALLFQLMAIPATLPIPTLCDKFKDQRILVLIVCLIYAFGMIGLLLGNNGTILIPSVICLAIGMGGAISLSIAFISLRTVNSTRASELSGMSQSAGYLLAALGPIFTGFIYDIQASWTTPLIIFIIFIALLAFFGLFAGKNTQIYELEDLMEC